MKRPDTPQVPEGWTVLRTKSYLAAQERQRRAECYLDAERRHNEGTLEWARQAFAEQRRLADRLAFVYGVARAHGATVEELRGES